MSDQVLAQLKEREVQLAEKNAIIDRELKQQELALSERKLQQEREAKDRELDIQSRQIAVGRWSGPVAVAVVAGLLGIIGTFFSAGENRELERKKQEGTLVIEAIRTGASGKEREQQAAANLVFLADAGLVNLGKEQLEKLRQKAGDATPSLPVGGSGAQPALPEPTRQQILKSFDEFAAYFQSIGARITPKVRVDVVPPNYPAIAYYDPGTSTVYVDTSYLADKDLPLREYAHAVLYEDGKYSAIDYEKTWAFVGIESGLASYFSSSFRNDPRVPGGNGNETLDNERNLGLLKPSPMIIVDGLYAWGGTFWALRKLFDSKTVDKILFTAWQDLREADLRRNDPKDFVAGLLKADAEIERSQHDMQIKELFSRRGMPQDR
jgi:hypothetical protein